MAVSIGGTIAGVPGIIIALPIYLLIRETYHFFKKDLKEGIDKVRDRMATLRWDLFETRQTVERKNIDIEKEREKIMHSVEEYPKLDYEYEKSVVFHSQPTPDEVFFPNRR